MTFVALTRYLQGCPGDCEANIQGPVHRIGEQRRVAETRQPIPFYAPLMSGGGTLPRLHRAAFGDPFRLGGNGGADGKRAGRIRSCADRRRAGGWFFSAYYKTGRCRWPQPPLNSRDFCNLVGISRRQINHRRFSQVFSAAAFSCWPSHVSKASRLIRCTAPIRTMGGVCFRATSFCQVLRLIPIVEITSVTVIS